jgi:hypothetical protein
MLGAGIVAQVIEHLPSTPEALSSNPSTAKKKQKNKNVEHCLQNSYIIFPYMHIVYFDQIHPFHYFLNTLPPPPAI